MSLYCHAFFAEGDGGGGKSEGVGCYVLSKSREQLFEKNSAVKQMNGEKKAGFVLKSTKT